MQHDFDRRQREFARRDRMNAAREQMAWCGQCGTSDGMQHNYAYHVAWWLEDHPNGDASDPSPFYARRGCSDVVYDACPVCNPGGFTSEKYRNLSRGEVTEWEEKNE